MSVASSVGGSRLVAARARHTEVSPGRALGPLLVSAVPGGWDEAGSGRRIPVGLQGVSGMEGPVPELINDKEKLRKRLPHKGIKLVPKTAPGLTTSLAGISLLQELEEEVSPCPRPSKCLNPTCSMFCTMACLSLEQRLSSQGPERGDPTPTSQRQRASKGKHGSWSPNPAPSS